MNHPRTSPTRRPGRRVGAALAGLVGALALSVGTTAWLSPLPAQADEIITIDLSGFTGKVVYQDGTSGPVVSVPKQEDGVQVASQCFDVPTAPSTDPTKGCLGLATQTDQPPLDVTGGENLFGLFKSEKAEGALGWMVPLARQELRVIYDMPDDDRLGTLGPLRAAGPDRRRAAAHHGQAGLRHRAVLRRAACPGVRRAGVPRAGPVPGREGLRRVPHLHGGPVHLRGADRARDRHQARDRARRGSWSGAGRTSACSPPASRSPRHCRRPSSSAPGPPTATPTSSA